MQAEILLLLACADADCGTGSPRVRCPASCSWSATRSSRSTSRRADVALYESVKQRCLAAGATLVHLTVSFRAVPELQHRW